MDSGGEGDKIVWVWGGSYKVRVVWEAGEGCCPREWEGLWKECNKIMWN